MSIAAVKTYARARMDALGYTEHYDGFNNENIPSTSLDGAYHVELGQAVGISNNQNAQRLQVPFTVRAYFLGGADVKSRIDEAIAEGDDIIAAFIDPTNRLLTSGIHNVAVESFEVVPVNNSNDNSLVAIARFTALVIMDTSQ